MKHSMRRSSRMSLSFSHVSELRTPRARAVGSARAVWAARRRWVARRWVWAARRWWAACGVRAAHGAVWSARFGRGGRTLK
eukprot:4925443-Prymnesium_polylepis.1